MEEEIKNNNVKVCRDDSRTKINNITPSPQRNTSSVCIPKTYGEILHSNANVSSQQNLRNKFEIRCSNFSRNLGKNKTLTVFLQPKSSFYNYCFHYCEIIKITQPHY